MKHTQGPWHLSDPNFVGKWAGFNTMQGKCYGIYATNEDLEAIALVPKDWMLTAKEQDNEANAKLIAAAPDLLYALELVYDHVKYHNLPIGSGAYEIMMKAIKKATE